MSDHFRKPFLKEDGDGYDVMRTVEPFCILVSIDHVSRMWEKKSYFCCCLLQEHAFESSQKYKEGKFIIELAHMIKDNGWEWLSAASSLLSDLRATLSWTFPSDTAHVHAHKRETHRHANRPTAHTPHCLPWNIQTSVPGHDKTRRQSGQRHLRSQWDSVGPFPEMYKSTIWDSKLVFCWTLSFCPLNWFWCDRPSCNCYFVSCRRYPDDTISLVTYFNLLFVNKRSCYPKSHVTVSIFRLFWLVFYDGVATDTMDVTDFLGG